MGDEISFTVVRYMNSVGNILLTEFMVRYMNSIGTLLLIQFMYLTTVNEISSPIGYTDYVVVTL